MTARKSLKIRQPTWDRFKRYKRDGESQTDALARLLDAADVPEILRCAECGIKVQAHARDNDGRIICFDCAGIELEQAPQDSH